LRRAGTVILGINIVLWFLATYPKTQWREPYQIKKQQAVLQFFPGAQTNLWKDSEMRPYLNAIVSKPGAETNSPAEFRLLSRLHELDREAAGEQLRKSFAGYLGRAIAPMIQPLGFDWKIGIGIIGSFAAREVFVSTMSTVYNVGETKSDEKGTASLAQMLQTQTRPDGSRLYTPLLGITIMVFYVFALQCVSTVAIVRRETNSWKWPAFQWIYMTALAWGLAFVTWHVGHLLGFR
jgi:ferrous iron transport protein B